MFNDVFLDKIFSFKNALIDCDDLFEFGPIMPLPLPLPEAVIILE